MTKKRSIYDPEELRVRHRKHVSIPDTNIGEDKQRRILTIIDEWKIYHVDPFKGEVYRLQPRKNGDKDTLGKFTMKRIRFHRTQLGRPLYYLYFKRSGGTMNTGSYETINAFHLMWLIAYGPFNEKLRLKPIDGDWENFKIANINVHLPLRKQIIEADTKPAEVYTRKARFADIRQIRGMMSVNPGIRAVDVCKILKLSYNSTYRVIKKIQIGEPMRFEKEGPYDQRADPYAHLIPSDIL